MTDDRSEMQANRAAGKARHQAQRLERATYTAAEVKALTKAAGDFGYELGRKETAEAIARALDERHRGNLALTGGDKDIIPREGRVGLATGYQRAAQMAREIGGTYDHPHRSPRNRPLPRMGPHMSEPRCPRCGSPRWASVSLDGGYTRRAQCIPCGTYHKPVIGPGWRSARFRDPDAVHPDYRESGGPK